MEKTEKKKQRWQGKHYSFYSHRECEYFPCHKTERPAEFNCLFCYCPLYALGADCGGNFTYRSSGVKDCTDCMLPHVRENYGLIIARFQDIVARMAQKPLQKDNAIHPL